jgi:hypothetical protein
MENNIKYRILPQRMNMMRRFSLAAMIALPASLVLSIFYEFLYYDALSRGASYELESLSALSSFTTAVNGIIVITALVFILRGVSNVANFIKTKYGNKYPEISFRGAAYVVPLVPWAGLLAYGLGTQGSISGAVASNIVSTLAIIGLLTIPFVFLMGQVVSSKAGDNTFFSKHRGLIKYGVLNYSFGLIINVFALGADEASSIIILGILVAALAITSFYLFKKYASLMLQELDNNPGAYIASGQREAFELGTVYNNLNTSGVSSIDSSMERIDRLGKMRSEGLITQEEFEALKKRELGL